MGIFVPETRQVALEDMVYPRLLYLTIRIMYLVMQRENKKHFIDVNYSNVFHLPNHIDTLMALEYEIPWKRDIVTILN